MKTTLRRLAIVGASAAMIAGGIVSPARAAERPPDLLFAAGQACSFPLGIWITGGESQVQRTFTDTEGNVVRTFWAGTGQDLTYMNMDSTTSFSTRANGAVGSKVINADDSSTTVSMGHNVIILTPPDVGSPSATLYVGRIVYNISASGVWEVVSTAGSRLDICSALSEG